MEAYLDYYLKDERFADLYNNGNERIRKYLHLVFEKSYLLFVLHEDIERKMLNKAIDDAKKQLTDEDELYLIKYSQSPYLTVSKLDWFRHGNGDCYGFGQAEHNTINVLLQENLSPCKIKHIDDATFPILLSDWVRQTKELFAKCKRTTPVTTENYSNDKWSITFLFDETWYILSPSDFNTDLLTFDSHALELMERLQQMGARCTRYSGFLD